MKNKRKISTWRTWSTTAGKIRKGTTGELAFVLKFCVFVVIIFFFALSCDKQTGKTTTSTKLTNKNKKKRERKIFVLFWVFGKESEREFEMETSVFFGWKEKNAKSINNKCSHKRSLFVPISRHWGPRWIRIAFVGIYGDNVRVRGVSRFVLCGFGRTKPLCWKRWLPNSLSWTRTCASAINPSVVCCSHFGQMWSRGAAW